MDGEEKQMNTLREENRGGLCFFNLSQREGQLILHFSQREGHTNLN